jgi:very-short-patch-repair endonuclease
MFELDGETHLAARQADAERTRFLEGGRWRVLRFWNTEVYDDLDAVKEAIYRACVSQPGSKAGPPSPPTPPNPSPPAVMVLHMALA